MRAAGAASLCSGVSASQVAAVVGHPVGGAAGSSGTSPNAALGSTTYTTCMYGRPTSLVAYKDLIMLSYLKMSKVPSRGEALAYVRSGLAKSMASLPKGEAFTYHIGQMFGLTNVWGEMSMPMPEIGKFTIEFAAGWRGTKVAEAVVWSPLPQAKLYSLEKLAVDNFGL